MATSRTHIPDDVTLVTAADDAYALPLAVMVRSALDSLDNSRRVRLVVLDGGLSAETKGRLLASWDAGRIDVQWIRPDIAVLEGLEVSRHISLATYFRILLPSLAPADVTRALYLDADLLIRRDLGFLWDEELGDATCLAVADTAAPCLDANVALANCRQCYRYLATTEPIPNYRELGLLPTAPYFNAGVLLFDLDRWRTDDLTARLLACLRENREHVRFWDQYALNVVLAGQWRELDPRWNQGAHAYTFPTWQESPFDRAAFDSLRRDPWIVHFTSGSKPWHYFCRHAFLPQYFAMLDRTAWRGWRPSLPQADLLSHWWRHRFAPVRHWYKVYAARASNWTTPARRTAA